MMTKKEVSALMKREFCMHKLGRSREDINKLTDEQVDELTMALCNVWDYMIKQEYAKNG